MPNMPDITYRNIKVYQVDEIRIGQRYLARL